jgi:hypothetical protein
MANFAASLRNPTTNALDIIANGSILTITDHSNYATNTQWNHLQADFSYYKRYDITLPDGTVVVGSTFSGGDFTIVPPSVCALPIITPVPYTTGDGVYKVVLSTCPTWKPVPPPFSNNWDIGDCVFYPPTALFYVCIDGITTVELPTNTANWTPIPYTSLSNKYLVTEYVAVVCDLNNCFASKVVTAVEDALCSGCNCLCENQSFKDAEKLIMILDSVAPLTNISAWNKIAEVINLGKTICNSNC